MLRKIPKLVTTVIFTALMSQTAAADATSTIRTLMSEIGAGRHDVVRPSHGRSAPMMMARSPDANSMVQAMLAHQGLARMDAFNTHHVWTRPGHTALDGYSFLFNPQVRSHDCSVPFSHVTITSFGSAANVTTLRVAPCVGSGNHSEFRLGTAMTAHRSLVFPGGQMRTSRLNMAWPMPFDRFAR